MILTWTAKDRKYVGRRVRNKKADSASTVVLWIGSLIAALICIAWFAKNLEPDHLNLQKMDNDLTQLKKDLNAACRMDVFWKNYYPKFNEGNLIINNLQVCMDSSACKVVYYDSVVKEPEFSGSDIIINEARKCENIEKCKYLYYSSENDAVLDFDNHKITIKDASTCENKHASIKRCRLLICSLNTSLHYSLKNITLINITRTTDGKFNFIPQ